MTLLEKEWFIEAPWGKLCVVAWGDCYDPPVLVCHGHLDSAAVFRPLIKLLPKKFYYLGIEVPGLGKSDPFPPGLLYTGFDLIYVIHVVVKHFRWKSFIYLAHSLGCSLGKFYDFVFPGKISRVIELDPVYGYLVIPTENMEDWYKKLFVDYFDNYHIYNGTKDGSPKYKKNEVISKLMKTRGFDKNMAEETLDRITEKTEDGYLRFTYDQRNKVVKLSPFTKEQAQQIFTNILTPTLTIICEESKQSGRYNNMEFLYDESSYPGNNYRARFVSGGHDVHINQPAKVAPYVSQFLNEGLKGLDYSSKI